ncbi:TetR/AcrR family transcriptional regulator, partial [Campylobacter jejuni]|nr:TetR/AcrR family transcriptional regulator [Campylobacter jejuni]
MNSNRKHHHKKLARQEKIKAVALELFLIKGYQETSLSDIIKLSGGSYSNI